MHRVVNGYWPAFFPLRKVITDESMKIGKVFWEMIFVTDEYVEVHDFLKTYFRMCTNINNYVPVRPWFDDPDEEEQWGCGYRDDMIAQFKQDYITKISLFKIKVKMMKLILSITELNFGLILLVLLRVQYLIIFMIMVITTKDWMDLFSVQREEN